MFGVGSEISAQIVESEAWDYLDAPIERVTGAGESLDLSLSLESDPRSIASLTFRSLSLLTDIPTPVRHLFFRCIV